MVLVRGEGIRMIKGLRQGSIGTNREESIEAMVFLIELRARIRFSQEIKSCLKIHL